MPALGPHLSTYVTGVRPGEKLHEVMIPEEEIRNTVDMGMYFVIQPNHHWWNVSDFKLSIENRGEDVFGMREYASDTNDVWLTEKQITTLIRDLVK